MSESFRWQRRAAISVLAVLLAGCAAPLSSAPVKQGTAPPITEITLERNCMGCSGASTLVLRRDGSAVFTLPGNLRRGTEDKTTRGSLATPDFEQLAAQLLSQGFFGLDEAYQDPQIQDGAWSAISVSRGGQVKKVFRREDAGPPALRALESAIEAVQQRIRFVP